ncbi:MAG: twin-arginine translocation signal domain-containing protein, partial [Bdellovibrionales bacterium]|nr:twin-arginine translocation signal domain-containing protein [Bdellovibrionales bacterium]
MGDTSNSKSLVILGQDNQLEGISRRKFLQMVGTASAAGAVAGCADSPKQNVLPFVQSDPDQIPGVAVWYSSTCTECSAGCGINVRTREGRAVKIEGNPESPVNSGGLCALGQSSLQSLYDPDRVREPLERVQDANGGVNFKPIGWEAAYKRIGDQLAASKGKHLFFTGELTGSAASLVDDFCKSIDADHLSVDTTQPLALAKATELVFGS